MKEQIQRRSFQNNNIRKLSHVIFYTRNYLFSCPFATTGIKVRFSRKETEDSIQQLKKKSVTFVFFGQTRETQISHCAAR